jgi:hypothetical protein
MKEEPVNGAPMASVTIFAILAFSVTAIAITALVIGYLEKRNALRQRGKSEELRYRYQAGGPPSAGPEPGE